MSWFYFDLRFTIVDFRFPNFLPLPTATASCLLPLPPATYPLSPSLFLSVSLSLFLFFPLIPQIPASQI